MKTFNAIMTSICSMSCGMNLMAGKWIAAGITALCAAYWFYKQVRVKKPKVQISDEAKETLKNLGVKVVVDGVEIN